MHVSDATLKSFNAQRKPRGVICSLPKEHTTAFPIKASSPVVKQPATMPFRVLLLDRGDMYMVCNEVHQNYTENDKGEVFITPNNASLSGTTYVKEFPDALEEFGTRCIRLGETSW